MPSSTINCQDDRSINSADGTATTAQDGGGVKTLHSIGTGWFLEVGQAVGFNVSVALMRFNTNIGAGYRITAATLDGSPYNDVSTQDFTLNAGIYDYGGSVDTGDFRTRAQLAALTKVASRTTAGGYASPFTSLAAFLTAINTTGFTNIILWSDRHEAGIAPTTDEYVRYAISADTPFTLALTYERVGGSLFMSY